MESVGTARPRVGPGAAVGVDEAMIRAQVHGFYGEIRIDPALGPIFNRAIQDWEPHLEKMCDFWSSVLLMTGRFKGSPMATHARLEGLGADALTPAGCTLFPSNGADGVLPRRRPACSSPGPR